MFKARLVHWRHLEEVAAKHKLGATERPRVTAYDLQEDVQELEEPFRQHAHLVYGKDAAATYLVALARALQNDGGQVFRAIDASALGQQSRK